MKKQIDPLAWIHDKKNTLQRDKERWLEIMEMFYKNHKLAKDPEIRAKIKEMMIFVGEQSREVKEKLKNYK